MSRRTMLCRSSQQWRPKVRQELITLLTTSPAQCVLACKHQCTVAVTAVWSETLWGLRKAVLATNVEESDRGMAADDTTKCLYLHHQGEFQHKYCAIVSLHHDDHGSVVRIFIGHSKVVKCLLLFMQHNFSPTRSVMSHVPPTGIIQDTIEPHSSLISLPTSLSDHQWWAGNQTIVPVTYVPDYSLNVGGH